jgi:hypothetical protein
MFSLKDRTIILTIGDRSEYIEFASREQMQAAMREWLESSTGLDKPSRE